jgi:hypothetical protein
MSAPQPMRQRTTSPSREKTGEVRIVVRSNSYQLGRSIPLEIRDARLTLVKRTTSGDTVSLLPGPYHLSAVLEDGQDHGQSFKVEAGRKLELSVGLPDDLLDTPGQRRGAWASSIRMRGARRVRGVPVGVLRFKSPELHYAEVVDENESGWLLRGQSSARPNSVPYATVESGGVITTISLPLTPSRTETPNTCVLRIAEGLGTSHISAWMGDDRIVANALQNMVDRGQLSSASEVSDQARDLFQDKYADPSAAALGALVLKKVNRLAPLEDWLENLSRDFSWMPDGTILLAASLFERRENMPTALSMMLKASRQRPLFTESYSILLDLLRRWPIENDRQKCETALETLASVASHVDWSSMCFSVRRG